MTIRQALLLIGFLILLLDDGFRELFFSALGVVLFLAVALGSPVFLYALIVGERADHRPGPGTWLLFGLWWALLLFLLIRWLVADSGFVAQKLT